MKGNTAFLNWVQPMNEISKIIAAVWDPAHIDRLENYCGNDVFLLHSDIVGLCGHIKQIKRFKKKVYLDIDFVDGLGSDEYAFRYVMLNGADGIITVKSKFIEIAKKFAVPAVLRTFALDSSAVGRIVDTVNNCLPDFLEVLPGSSFGKVKNIIKRAEMKKIPKLIAAGLIEQSSEVELLLREGACAISTSSENLWKEIL